MGWDFFIDTAMDTQREGKYQRFYIEQHFKRIFYRDNIGNSFIIDLNANFSMGDNLFNCLFGIRQRLKYESSSR